MGVVRVEAECFKFFASQKHPNVRFCHFDKESRTFHEIGADYVLGIFNLHGHVPPDAPRPPTVAKRATQRAR